MKKFLKVVLMLTLVMSLAIPLASCGGSGENKDSKKDETLVVGMEPTFPPFDAQDKKGNFEGFDVDLMNAIAKDQNLKIEFKQFEFDGLIPALNSGNCDIVASGMAIMKEKKRWTSQRDTSIQVFALPLFKIIIPSSPWILLQKNTFSVLKSEHPEQIPSRNLRKTEKLKTLRFTTRWMWPSRI